MTRLRAALSSRWAKLALSAALLGVLLHETDLGEIRAALAAADPALLGTALLGLIASQVVSAYRWYLLARPLGFDERFPIVCGYYFSGMYLNLFGPGTVTGDVGRTLFLAGGRRRRALALTTVVAHRAIGFVALVWITATAIALLPDQPLPPPLRWLAALAIPATVVGWLRGPRLAARLLPAGHRWRRMIEHDLDPYWHNHRLLAAGLALAAAAHLIQLGAQLAVARALGLALPWSFFLVSVPLVNVAAMLPITLQGIGVRESGFLLALAALGVPREAALALGLLTSAVTMAAGLTGLPVFILMRRASPAAPEAR